MKARIRWEPLIAVFIIALFAEQGCGQIPAAVTELVPPSGTLPAEKNELLTPSPSPTVAPSTTPDFVATQFFIETDSINAVIATVQPELLAEYPSPNGKWQVKLIRYDCINYSIGDYIGIIAYEQLKLINLRDRAEKIIADQRLNCDGIGGGGLKGLYWSPNNRYFYFTDWREGYPETCGNYAVPAIYRLDTVTQKSITVGGGHLSPDETKLAMWKGDEIVIWDLDRGEIGRIQSLVPDFLDGDIAWAPNGQSLVYLQTEYDCARDYGTTYVIRLDLGKMSQTLLFRYPPPGYGEVSWDIPSQVTLRDGDGKFWVYNLTTRDKEFLGDTPFTPTRVPPGTYALFFYSPLIITYNPSLWEPDLHARNLKSCFIGEQGPTDFNGPHTSEIVRLGKVEYEVLSFPEKTDRIAKAYIASQAFAAEAGVPVFWVSATPEEWEKCKTQAENVLATLHSP